MEERFWEPDPEGGRLFTFNSPFNRHYNPLAVSKTCECIELCNEFTLKNECKRSTGKRAR